MRQHHSKFPGAWLLAASALIVLLLASIAWLAHVNATTLRPLPVPERKGRALPTEYEYADSAAPSVHLAKASIPPLVMVVPEAAPPRVLRPILEKPVPARRSKPARKTRPPAPAQTPEPVDSDVALISAIIAQSSRHAEERGEPNDARLPIRQEMHAINRSSR